MTTSITQNTIPLTQLDAVARPIEQAVGMPGTAYTSEALFHFERDQVLGPTWSGLVFASEVAANGSLVPVDFMGLPLIVTRDHNGLINVFHNVCSHRGMTLVSEANTQARGIRCPYHSWRYDLSGNLKSTPSIGGARINEVAGFSCENHGLKRVRSHVWMGIVFINLSDDAPDFTDFIAPLETRWRQFLGAGLFDELRVPEQGASLEIDLQCNWKLAVENYCESYHLPSVHPTLNTYSPLDQHYNIVASENMSGQGSCVYNLSGLVDAELPRFPHWPEEKMCHAEYISLYPNVLLGLQPDHLFAMIVQPKAPGKIVEKLQLYYIGAQSLDESYEECRSAVLKSWQQVFSEDIFVVEGMQNARTSPGFTGGVFSPVMDVCSHHFHQWLAHCYKTNTVRL
ncbi:MAG TPA: aromatic ring-hydroxylating dioxygenase subunit alpha [Pseudomonadales bacterium]|nr:aromatic ring-hydroxylating dioxygenase subunit alpha [Pseudomonadales bacterium]